MASRETGITFQHPTAFWLGTIAVASGVLAHMPAFVGASAMGYRMSGMPMSPLMLMGMMLIVAGLASAAYGLIPFGDAYQPAMGHVSEGVHFLAMDGARLSGQHWRLLFILGVALVVNDPHPGVGLADVHLPADGPRGLARLGAELVAERNASGASLRTVSAPCTSMRMTTSMPLVSASRTCSLGIPL